MATALTNTGAGDIVGNAVSGLLANSQNGYLLGAAFFIVSFLFTQLMLNKAVYGIFIPIAIMTCQALGANPIGPIHSYGNGRRRLRPEVSAQAGLADFCAAVRRLYLLHHDRVPGILIGATL